MEGFFNGQLASGYAFASALNQHGHLHACVTDRVFERRVTGGGVTFHAAQPLTASDLAAKRIFSRCQRSDLAC